MAETDEPWALHLVTRRVRNDEDEKNSVYMFRLMFIHRANSPCTWTNTFLSSRNSSSWDLCRMHAAMITDRLAVGSIL